MSEKKHTFQDTIDEVRAHREWGNTVHYRLLDDEGNQRVIELRNNDAYLFGESDFVRSELFSTRDDAELALALHKNGELSYAQRQRLIMLLSEEG